MAYFKSGSYQGPVKYLFIDAGYLDKALEKFKNEIFNLDELKLDYAKVGKEYSKVFYYDCLPKETNPDYKQKKEFLESLRLIDNFHVFEGKIVGSNKRQKQVDVLIAVHMLQHSYRGNMHEATLITGDLDFKPILDALLADGMVTTLFCDPRTTSKELMRSADMRRIINIEQIINWLPDAYNMRVPSKILTPATATQSHLNVLEEGRVRNSIVRLCIYDNGSIKTYFLYEINSGNIARWFSGMDKNLLKLWYDEQHGPVNWDKTKTTR